ncbi:guanine-nucleotide dissociation stimulator CDC25 [Trichodelitschia bisporula]|uniref:Class E vacuolar protein-sorting machinery protein HSE1 n=1 Tax=Trichodelitschia bisporula TaxID=703511 RepID=A0A6G1HS23_9PEZI|nr:guanine-nucleotide dissociation stimulator CDC25 [Trichodelitschia bisporula]
MHLAVEAPYQSSSTQPALKVILNMNGYAGTAAPPGGMYVRALYDYEADDRTSLSFRQGEIIQVITQLESGWWDGYLNGVRGWFPSNYCTLVSGPNENGDEDHHLNGEADDADVEDDPNDEYDDLDYEEADSVGNPREDLSRIPGDGMEERDQEEAAFWIPQATPDGRLYYFNTLTGSSTMELPLETPLSTNENGPRDRTHIFIPEHTRPPPELMAGGYEMRDDDTEYDNSASEAEGRSAVDETGSLKFKRRSYPSDGVSPATSMDSIKDASRSRPGYGDPIDPSLTMVAQSALPPNGTTMTSYVNDPLGPQPAPGIGRQYFDDAGAVPLTWNRLIEDMRKAVERFRQAIDNADRAEFVKRAEDISDHLRLILGAGSGTTDNHSGSPSIISSNKALYPHFRETMSRFSKLVLSAHIAAADFPPPDSYAKCLKEANGVLNGVYGFVEVAREQRGEEIPRLTPGFVPNGNRSGGNWRNNGLISAESSLTEKGEMEPFAESGTPLDLKLFDRLTELRSMIDTCIRRLDEQLVLQDKAVTPLRHRIIGDTICKSAGRVIDAYRPYISTVESVNLTPMANSPAILDFNLQKQRIYDLISELVLVAQAVASPLADEWAENRGFSLEDRMKHVAEVLKDLRITTSQIISILQRLADSVIVVEEPRPKEREENRKIDSGVSYQSRIRSASNRSMASSGMDIALDGPGPYRPGGSAKVEKFFGEVPAPLVSQPVAEEAPAFLRLDFESEITYDTKVSPPQLKGGTLTALVEQLTRHDRLDSPFNNTFLLTYRSFTTANELFEMLVNRWGIQPPEGLSAEDYQTWVDKKQKPIQFRVVNILKSWFDNYWMEGNDEEARALMMRVLLFAKDFVATTNTPGAAPLITTIESRLKGQDTAIKRLVLTMNQTTPSPILPRNMRKLKFLDIDVTEFARQLTIIESRLYGKIKPTECLNKTWQKKLLPGEADPAANIKSLIFHSNQLTNWVAQIILNQTEVKRRVAVIKHFVSVADKCRGLNNFSTLTSIISALGTAPIHRLSRTWHQVNGKTKETLESMRALMASTKNFAVYRDTLHKANPPCTPFLGVYLTDLTFIEDGIPSVIKKSNLINFAKRAKTAEVIRDIQQYQNVPYPLQPVPELQEFIMASVKQAGDVHEMYEQSLAVEPREREDEKIARYGNH